ncbi:MAG: MopE-related protein [Myxococcota bacterium]
MLWILQATAATWSVPLDFPNLQIAVDSPLVVSGDIVLVEPGDRQGFELGNGKVLTVRGTGSTNTLLLGSPGGPPVVATFGTLTLESLTLDGQGITRSLIVQGGSEVIANDVDFTNGQANGDGGCVYLLGGSFEGANTDFSGCQAGLDGGALYAEGPGSVILSSGTVENNDANGNGGAIGIGTGQTLQVYGTWFNQNHAAGNGGAIWCNGAAGCSAEFPQFEQNSAGGNGGAVFVANTVASIEAAFTMFNSASAGGAFALGSGASADLAYNGVYLGMADQGGAWHVGSTASLFARNNYVCGNQGMASGGALMAASGSSVDVANVLFAANGAQGTGFSVELQGSGLFAHNTLYADLGGGVRSTAGTVIEDNLITNSSGVGLQGPGSNPPIRNNVLFGPSATGVAMGQQIFADPGMVGMGATIGDECTFSELPYATAAVFDVTSSGRVDIDGTQADAGHYGGPDFEPDIWGADLDGDGYHQGLDCDESNPSVNPGATEIPCNGVSESCGASPDLADDDGDGFSVCVDDCDDANPAIRPGAPETTCNGVDDDCNPATVDAPDLDADGASTCLDCDDADPTRFPGAPEVCDEVDNDCNGGVDDGLPTSDWFQDLDGDSWGDAVVATSCAQPPGSVEDGGDCDDTLASIHPGAIEVCDGVDQDCDGTADDGIPTTDWYDDGDSDGYGTTVVASSCLQPPGTADVDGDCNDSVASIHPNAIETCDNVDNDCDGMVDDGVTTTDWYDDDDNDGYGDTFVATDCAQPAGTAPLPGDCNDASAAIRPGATETCDGVDQDCDGVVDDGIPTMDWYGDGDRDGFGDVLVATSCQQPPDTAMVDGDCDDTSSVVYPGAPEDCDGADNDCDGLVDDDDPDTTAPTWYVDLDDDNFGDDLDPGVVACVAPADTVSRIGDCDDADPTIFPLAVEACPDGIDNDCDTLVDTDDPDYTVDPVEFWFDQDGDGTGTPAAVYTGCSGTQPLGYVSPNLGEDCDDGDFTISPLQGEICDGIDNDCTGVADDGVSFADFYPDADGDGFGDPNGTTISSCEPVPGYVIDDTDCDDGRGIIYPGRPETCDNLDNDCNGQIDDGLAFFDYYPDGDGDGFGSQAQGTNACTPVPGWITLGGDCDDSNELVNPNAFEDPDDNIDNNCDGIGFVPMETGDTGLEPLLDSDGDGVPDFLDPEPFSVGDGEGQSPTPQAGCSCSTRSGGAGWLVLALPLLLVLRR